MIWDREKAREVLGRYDTESAMTTSQALDALAGCVTDDPPTIDRDALERQLWTLVERVADAQWYNATVTRATDSILALLRPDPRIAAAEYDSEMWAKATERVRVAESRIAKLEALCDATGSGFPYLQVREVRVILRGEG